MVLRAGSAHSGAVSGTSSASISLCIGLPGLTKSAMFEAPGTSSRRHVASRTRQALDETDRHRIEYSHEYNRLVAVADFRARAACGPPPTTGVRVTRSAARADRRPIGNPIDPAVIAQAVLPPLYFGFSALMWRT
jgi:hypothetical protein